MHAAGGDAGLAAELLRLGGQDPETDRITPGTPLAAGDLMDIARAFSVHPRVAPPSELVAGIERVFVEGAAAHCVLIDRKGDDFLCRGGMGEFQASINQLGPGVTVGELAAKYGEKSKTGIGTDVRLPAAAAYEPKFLPFEKYAPKQHKLRMEMVGTLAELLK
jgi:hypothetical protein